MAGKRGFASVARCAAVGALLAAPAHGEPEQLREYKIKAAFLLQLTKFVRWPEMDPPPGTFSVCTRAPDGVAELVEQTLAGKSALGVPIQTRRLSSQTSATSCRIVFVAYGEPAHETITARAPVLVVSEARAFGVSHSMVTLVLVDDLVRLEIDVQAARTAGLEISSKLLAIARIAAPSVPASPANPGGSADRTEP